MFETRKSQNLHEPTVTSISHRPRCFLHNSIKTNALLFINILIKNIDKLNFKWVKSLNINRVLLMDKLIGQLVKVQNQVEHT